MHACMQLPQHPHTVQDISKDPDAHSKFSEMTAAYNVLKDPRKRAAYDLERSQPACNNIMRSHINKMDPLYEAMRRHQEEQKKSRQRTSFWTTHEEWCALSLLPFPASIPHSTRTLGKRQESPSYQVFSSMLVGLTVSQISGVYSKQHSCSCLLCAAKNC